MRAFRTPTTTFTASRLYRRGNFALLSKCLYSDQFYCYFWVELGVMVLILEAPIWQPFLAQGGIPANTWILQWHPCRVQLEVSRTLTTIDSSCRVSSTFDTSRNRGCLQVSSLFNAVFSSSYMLISFIQISSRGSAIAEERLEF